MYFKAEDALHVLSNSLLVKPDASMLLNNGTFRCMQAPNGALHRLAVPSYRTLSCYAVLNLLSRHSMTYAAQARRTTICFSANSATCYLAVVRARGRLPCCRSRGVLERERTWVHSRHTVHNLGIWNALDVPYLVFAACSALFSCSTWTTAGGVYREATSVTYAWATGGDGTFDVRRHCIALLL